MIMIVNEKWAVKVDHMKNHMPCLWTEITKRDPDSKKMIGTGKFEWVSIGSYYPNMTQAMSRIAEEEVNSSDYQTLRGYCDAWEETVARISKKLATVANQVK